jgi:hypothetical protein
MITYTEAVQNNMSRLVIGYTRVGSEDRFNWGVAGSCSVMSFIGALSCIHQRIVSSQSICSCEEQVLAIVVDNGKFLNFLGDNIPLEPLLGMLEVVKSCLVDACMANMQSGRETGLVGVNGKPILRG